MMTPLLRSYRLSRTYNMGARLPGLAITLVVLASAISSGTAEPLTFECFGDVCNANGQEQVCSETLKMCQNCDLEKQTAAFEATPCYNSVSRSKCPAVTYISNGTLSDVVREYGASIQFTCHPGYKLVGEGTLRCLEYGHWSSPVPKCEAIRCTELQNTHSGEWNFDGDGDPPNTVTPATYGLGVTATFACTSENAVLKGAATWTCSQHGQPNAHWVSTNKETLLPSCGVQTEHTQRYKDMEALADKNWELLHIWIPVTFVATVIITLLVSYLICKYKLCEKIKELLARYRSTDKPDNVDRDIEGEDTPLVSEIDDKGEKADTRSREGADTRSREGADTRIREEADTRIREGADTRIREEADTRSREGADTRSREEAEKADDRERRRNGNRSDDDHSTKAKLTMEDERNGGDVKKDDGDDSTGQGVQKRNNLQHPSAVYIQADTVNIQQGDGINNMTQAGHATDDKPKNGENDEPDKNDEKDRLPYPTQEKDADKASAGNSSDAGTNAGIGSASGKLTAIPTAPRSAKAHRDPFSDIRGQPESGTIELTNPSGGQSSNGCHGTDEYYSDPEGSQPALPPGVCTSYDPAAKRVVVLLDNDMVEQNGKIV